MIRRGLSAEDEPALLAALHADSLALGVAVERPWRRQLLEDPRELGCHLERVEDAPEWLLVRRHTVWLEGSDAVFGEVIPVGTELGGGPGTTTASPTSCPLAPNAVDWSMTSAAPWERLVFGPFGFDLVRTQLALVAPFADVRSGAAPGVQMSEVSEFPEAVEGLARKVAGEVGALAARDKALLDWRFTKREGCAYRIGLAKRAGELVGCTVLRRTTFDGRADQGLVCEWLVPGGDPAVGNALRSYLVERARADGAQRLVALLPDWHPSWFEFQDAGFRVERTRALVCARSRARRHEATWLAKRWYTTLFDGSLA